MSKMDPKNVSKSNTLKTISVKLESGGSSSLLGQPKILTIPPNSPLVNVKIKREGGQVKRVFASMVGQNLTTNNSPNSPFGNIKIKREVGQPVFTSVVGQNQTMINPSKLITIKRQPGQTNAVMLPSVVPQTQIVKNTSKIITIKRQPVTSLSSPIRIKAPPVVQNVATTNKKLITIKREPEANVLIKRSEIVQNQAVNNAPKYVPLYQQLSRPTVKAPPAPTPTPAPAPIPQRQTASNPSKLITIKKQQQQIVSMKTPTVTPKQTIDTPEVTVNPNRYILLNSTETDYDNFRFAVDGVEYRIVRESKKPEPENQTNENKNLKINVKSDAELKEPTYDEQIVSEKFNEHLKREIENEEYVGEETVENECFDCVGQELVYEEDVECNQEYTVCDMRQDGLDQLVWGLNAEVGQSGENSVDASQSTVNEEMTDDHSGVEQQTEADPIVFFYCDICGKSFKTVRSVNIHMKRSHNVISSKIGTTKTYKRPYRVRPPAEKKFVCDTCGKKFGSNAFLKYHLRTHTGEKPYQCQLCPKRFAMPIFLQIHTRTHTGERPYPCEVCKKGFISKPALLRHHMVHTGEKPYQCPECGKTFSQSNSMKLHVHTVHLKLPSPYKSTAKKKKEALALQQLMAQSQAEETIAEENQDEQTYSDEDDERNDDEERNDEEEGNDDDEMEEVPYEVAYRQMYG